MPFLSILKATISHFYPNARTTHPHKNSEEDPPFSLSNPNTLTNLLREGAVHMHTPSHVNTLQVVLRWSPVMPPQCQSVLQTLTRTMLSLQMYRSLRRESKKCGLTSLSVSLL